MHKHRALLLSAILIANAGCTTAGGNFPSLEPRAIESMRFEVAPAPPAEVVIEAPSGDVAAQLSVAEESRAAFAELLPSAERAIVAARNGTAGGEAWVEAQTALSRLDRAAAPAAIALASLDSLMIEAAAGPLGTSASLAEAWGKVNAIAAEQRAAITGLTASLPQP